MADNSSNYFEVTDATMQAVLGHCLLNQAFLRDCASTLQKEHVENPLIGNLYSWVIEYYKRRKAKPSVQEVEAYINTEFKYDAPIRSKYIRILGESVDLHAKNFNRDELAFQVHGWIRANILKNFMQRAVNSFNKKGYIETENQIKKLERDLRDAEFNKEERVDMSDMANIVNSMLVVRDKACTLGHPEFDELILAGASRLPTDVLYNENTIKGRTKGSLVAGAQTIMMGPSNTGKTTAMVTIAVSNLAFEKKVCYISCEDPKEQVSMKMMQSFFSITAKEISNTSSRNFEEQSAQWAEVANKYLHLFEWIKPGKMYVEDVIALIEVEQEKLVERGESGFDLVIVDYPGILSSRDLKGTKEEWTEKRYIYSQFRLLARKHSWHSLVPIQTNREGFKMNMGQNYTLEISDVAQGFGITNDADNVITINRSNEDYTVMRVRFFVAKTRTAEARSTFMSETRYDLSRTHGLAFGCSVLSASELKDLNEPGLLATRIKRNMTSQMLGAKSDEYTKNSVAFNMADGGPPIKTVMSTTSSSWNVPVDPQDLKRN
jgi:replicative DNA helicase